MGVVRALLAELRAVGAWGWGWAGSRAGGRAGGKAGGCTFPNQTPHSCSVPRQASPRMIRSCAASSAESLAAAPPLAAALVVAPLLLLRMGVGAPGPEFSCRLSVRCTSVCYPKPKKPRLFALPSERKAHSLARCAHSLVAVGLLCTAVGRRDPLRRLSSVLRSEPMATGR